MSVVLCVSVAWAATGLLFMGLGLAVLLLAERASDWPGTMITDDGIADHATRTADVDLTLSDRESAHDAQEFAGDLSNLNGISQLGCMVTSAFDVVNAKACRTLADRKEHPGGLVIRDPRLTDASGALERSCRCDRANYLQDISNQSKISTAEILSAASALAKADVARRGFDHRLRLFADEATPP
jgi:hypothetical protein